MAHRLFAVIALGLGFALTNMLDGNQQPEPKKERAKLLETQMIAARATFETLWADEGINSVEMLYQWSRRWFEAERLIKDKKEDQVTAATSHVDRMKRLQERSTRLFQQKLMTKEQVSATDFFVAEAEMWSLQTK